MATDWWDNVDRENASELDILAARFMQNLVKKNFVIPGSGGEFEQSGSLRTSQDFYQRLS